MIITATHILFAITFLPFLSLKSFREKGIFLTPTCSNSKNIWFCFYIWKVKPSSVNFELLVSVSIFLLFYVQLCSMTSCILFFFLFFYFSVAYPIRSKLQHTIHLISRNAISGSKVSIHSTLN